jgi:hypothetical protein
VKCRGRGGPGPSAPDGLRSRDLRLDRAVRTPDSSTGARYAVRAPVRAGAVLPGAVLRSCRAPNGIRTRASALKGRRPRPLDDGGPDPPRGDSRKSIATRRFPGAEPRLPFGAPMNRSPGRTPEPAASSSTCRPCGAVSLPDGTVRTRTTRSRRSSQATSIANRIPIVCTDRHRKRKRASSGGNPSEPSRPRARSRWDSGTRTRRARPRSVCHRSIITECGVGRPRGREGTTSCRPPPRDGRPGRRSNRRSRSRRRWPA